MISFSYNKCWQFLHSKIECHRTANRKHYSWNKIKCFNPLVPLFIIIILKMENSARSTSITGSRSTPRRSSADRRLSSSRCPVSAPAWRTPHHSSSSTSAGLQTAKLMKLLFSSDARQLVCNTRPATSVSRPTWRPAVAGVTLFSGETPRIPHVHILYVRQRTSSLCFRCISL